MTTAPRPDWDVPLDRSAFSESDLHTPDTTDRDYWLSRKPEERVHAIEIMRQQLYGTDPVNDRIQRVLEIVECPPR